MTTEIKITFTAELNISNLSIGTSGK